jgi:tetratricopeptide (TPR) repeat protein
MNKYDRENLNLEEKILDQNNKVGNENNYDHNQLQEINELIENLDYDSAKILLVNKLKVDPDNTEVLDLYSEVLMGLDETETAIKCMKKSIALEPNKNPEKYMTLAQLSDYKNALKLYEKGIQVYQNELLNVNDDTKKQTIQSSLASAYAAVAELFMNSDLW